MKRFNEFVAAGVDEDFGRGDEAYDRAFSGGGRRWCRSTTRPFHAAAFGLSDLGTKGGLVTDTHARVLDTDGNPIGGLYAAGNTMAAVSGTAYPGGGNPIGASMLFSHLAALDMAGERQLTQEDLPMASLERYTDRRVLITGGGSGIGQATVLRILDEGGRVVAADISESGLKDTVARAEPHGDRLTTVVIDVASEDSVKEGVAEAVRALGGMDALVNAAGILRSAHFLDTTLADFEQVLRINLVGTFLVSARPSPRCVMAMIPPL